jgi:hypothetical protein
MPPPTRPVVSGSGSGSEAAAVSSSGGTGDNILVRKSWDENLFYVFSNFFSYIMKI